jgi:hypothetical protein
MSEDEVNEAQSKTASLFAILFFIVYVVWGISIIAAFIQAVVCFSRSHDVVRNMLGLLVATVFGPFYWLYYFMDPGYCGIGSSPRF